MSDEEYNGWPNRETWALHLHLTNDGALYNEVRHYIRQQVETSEYVAEYGLGSHTYANYLDQWVSAMFDAFWDPDDEGIQAVDGLVGMMVREVGSLWRVDFKEVADALMEE